MSLYALAKRALDLTKLSFFPKLAYYKLGRLYQKNSLLTSTHCSALLPLYYYPPWIVISKMHLSPRILVALAAWAVPPVMNALPVDTSPAPADLIVKTIQDRADHCDGTTWEDQTSLGSPVVSDCLTLADRLGEYTWFIPSGQKQIAQVRTGRMQLIFAQYRGRKLIKVCQWGTCAFGVTSLDPIITTPRIGNDNVRDLIRGAVQRFQWNSRVGAKGVTSCQWNAGWTPIEWGLYHD